MNNIILLTICFLPCLFFLIYFYKEDKIEKEPFSLLIILFICGIISSCLTVIISMILKSNISFINLSYSDLNLIQIIIKVLFGIVLVEELIKWLFVYLISWKNKNFNYIFDAIVYCVFLSMGFAFLENIIYVHTFNNYEIRTMIVRSLISVPSHIVYSANMGYYLGLAKYYLINNDKKRAKKYKVLSLVIPVYFHLVYDLLLVSKNDFIFMFFIFYNLVTYYITYTRIKKLSSIKKNIS